MRSQLVGPALAMVRAAGGDVAALRARFALPDDAETTPDVTLPLPALEELLDACAAASGDPGLGLHLAARMPRGAYGVLEFASASAPTIRESVLRIARYMSLLNEVVTVRVEEHDGVGTVEQRFAGAPRGLGRHGNEFFVATLLGRARMMSGQPFVPVRAWFAHAQPPHESLAELLAFLGTTHVRFDAGGNGIAMAADVLDIPLRTSDPPLLDLLDRTAEQSLAAMPATSPLPASVRRHVRDTLADVPSLESTAAALKMSPRTLQRRLSDDGTSFQQVLDDVRHAVAVDLIKDPRRPLGEIAFLLGYSELSPFVRAYKRWTGKTPRGA
jgi:AraC-like DNA-binding protein